MAKIKLTKGELKRQRDSLKQFEHYLPTLQLKKQQLQLKILEARRALAEKTSLLDKKEKDVNQWIGLLADPELLLPRGKSIDVKKWAVPEKVDLGTMNIAGANVPVVKKVTFRELDYDLYATPFWMDRGIAELREFVELMIEVAIIKKQIATLEHELRVTTQRVNLFEKIKIPECQENIRVIRIYLGDQMASAVGISKVAKKKIDESMVVAEVAV